MRGGRNVLRLIVKCSSLCLCASCGCLPAAPPSRRAGIDFVSCCLCALLPQAYRNIIRSRRAYVITWIILIMFPCDRLQAVFIGHSHILLITFLITLITFHWRDPSATFIRLHRLPHKNLCYYRPIPRDSRLEPSTRNCGSPPTPAIHYSRRRKQPPGSPASGTALAGRACVPGRSPFSDHPP
jgi:hypothetical protein